MNFFSTTTETHVELRSKHTHFLITEEQAQLLDSFHNEAALHV